MNWLTEITKKVLDGSSFIKPPSERFAPKKRRLVFPFERSPYNPVSQSSFNSPSQRCPLKLKEIVCSLPPLELKWVKISYSTVKCYTNIIKIGLNTTTNYISKIKIKRAEKVTKILPTYLLRLLLKLLNG